LWNRAENLDRAGPTFDLTEMTGTMNPTLLAAGSWCWHAAYYAGRWSLLDQPAGVVAAGLTAMECNDFMLPPPRLSRVRRPLLALLPGAPPELWRYSRATLRQLQANAAAQRVAILTWAINSDFTLSASRWPAQQLYLRRGLAAARLLGAPLLRITLGGAATTPPSRDALVARRLAAFVRASQRHAPDTAVTLENHWGLSSAIECHVRIYDAAAGLLPDALRDRFGCCFDPGNVPDGAGRAEQWRALAARANHFHLKAIAFDAAGTETNLPYPLLFDLLTDAGYRGPVTVEYAGDGDAVAGIRQSVRLYEQIRSQRVGVADPRGTG
jgi:sugar phosphate isomerase/epimerase